MRTFIPIAAALALIASSASAQNPPANSGPGNNAINSPSTTNTAAPVEGRNSFTEGQARSRMEASGFAEVSGLQKDDAGVWRGRAKKDGKAVGVALDFQGNVVAK
jgi:hypothetical protein